MGHGVFAAARHNALPIDAVLMDQNILLLCSLLRFTHELFYFL